MQRRIPLHLRDRGRMSPARSLYIHIPFCASRCYYCDFTTYVAPSGVIDTYLEHLARELELLQADVTVPLETVFFGGGTPTLPNAGQLQTLLRRLRDTLPIADDAEVTMEANPGTVDIEKLAVLRASGVNRLSFGAQTFDSRLLMTIGRLHDVEAVYQSVDAARSAGFERINLDLMFGLPEQSLGDVEDSLSQVVALGVNHISAYWLKVEENTPFGQWRARGLLPLPGEDLEGDMYDLVRQTLQQSGFTHYEVSNFARRGEESRHNLVYWRNQPFFAAGVAAHGYVNGVRSENLPNLSLYGQAVTAGQRPSASNHRVSIREACEDTMMLGLRLAEGVSKHNFTRRHGLPMEAMFGTEIQRLLKLHLLEWTDGRLRLTDQAWPIANTVFEAFIGA